MATEQAREAQRPVTEELELLCTHGILHLLGFDHAEADERATMFGLQDRLLDSWRAERAPGQATGEPGAAAPPGTAEEPGTAEAPGAAELNAAGPDPAGARERDESG